MSDVDIIINVATQGAKSITDLSASLRSLNKNLVDLNIPIKKLDAHSQSVAKALGMGARSANDHAKSLKGLIANQKALGAETRRIKTEIGAYRAAIGFAGASNKAFADSARKSVTQLKQMDRALRGMRIRAFGSDLRATSTRIQKIGKDAQFVGRSLMINLTAPLTLFARVGFQQLLAVDKELVRLTKVLDNVALSADQANRKLGPGSTPQQVQGLTDAFTSLNNELTKISSNYGVSKQLVVGLASDFAELGLTGHESIIALTELTAQIEKLGAMDIGGAQDLTQALYFQSIRAYENTGAFEGMTSAIDREALAVKAATTQMQLFNAIENVTALTLKDLGQAFPEVASMAVSMGLSMTEAAAMLAPMKAAGLDVGASANSIKVSLQRAISPTTKNIKILKALAESFGEAGDKSSAFATANKTGLTGLQSITEIFDKVMASKGGMEGALKLMSNLFEKRQGPRMFLAIEQLSLFNKELNIATRSSTSAEGLLAGVAESALREFNTLNKTALPETVNNFKDIGILARIATAHVGQEVEGFVDAQGELIRVSALQIKTAKEARKAVADRIILEKQTKGRDVVSEVKTETGRAMLIELAGASNAAEVANAELGESLKALSVVTEKLKNNFKLFAADIFKAVVPTLQKLSDKVQELMDKWNNSTQEFKDRVSKVITSITAFLAILGPLVLAMGTLQAVTGVLGRSIATFIPKLRTQTGEFIGLGHAIGAAKTQLTQYNAVQNGTFLSAIRNKLTKKTGNIYASPQAAIDDLTAASKAKFGTGYKKIENITPAREAKILQEQQFKSFQRLNPSSSPVAAQKKLFKESQRISAKVAKSGAFSLTPKEVAFQAKNALKIASVPTAMSEGATVATPMIARKKQIFDKASVFAKKGMMTDADGSKFFTRRGREISEARANQLATGRFAAPVTDPLRRFGQRRVSGMKSFAKDPVAALAAAPRAIGRSIGRTVTRVPTAALSARAAMSAGGVKLADKATDILGTPGKVLTKATNNAKDAITKLNAQYALFGQGAPSAMAKAKTAMMAFGKSIKSVTVLMKVMKMMMLTTGIGAALAVIGIAIYAVMKNLDSFKKGAKPLLDALSTAFGQIKEAVMLTIQPIMDLFGAFGSGGTDGAAAANGIGEALAKLAGVVEFVSGIIQNFLLKVVKPIFSAIANIVMAVVSVFKGNWSDAFGFLLAALGHVGKAFINIWKLLATTTISIIAGIVKGGIRLFFNLVNGLAQMVIGALKIVVRTADNILGKIGLGSVLDGVMGSLDAIGGKVSRGISTVSDGIQSVVGKGADLAKKGVGKIADGINSVLDKATSKGLKDTLTKNKKPVVDAGKELGEAGGEAIANAMGDASAAAADKAGKAIKDGIKDAAQGLQDFVRNAFKSALNKMINATVAAMKKQKEAGLKVFDVQLKTLDKLAKAEASLTKTKEYQMNLRKILDDRDLNRANYVRNRALAIYEGRVDDARMLDLEQQGAEKSSVLEETEVKDSRKKDLAAENLAALRDAIAEAKVKAGELFDLQIEAFQKAAADIIKIGPVTIEQYTVMQKELETLANTSSTKMNEDFGTMFENFVTTIGDKMPNQVVGAFSTSLDLLVAEAQSKYGLGSDPSENTIIGVTLGMLTSIGDVMGDGAPAVVAAFGAITTDLKGNFTEAKDAILVDVQDAFLKPFKKAFDEADPTAVFNQAIKDGNASILRDFENTLALNDALMKKIAGSLDPAIIGYIKLKAAADAAADAMANAGNAPPNKYTDPYAGMDAEARRHANIKEGVDARMKAFLLRQGDSHLRQLALSGDFQKIYEGRNAARNKKVVGRKEGGYIPAPETEGVPALLHGGEYVLNAKAVNRIGLGALEKMNNNLIPQFKKGGRVPGGARSVTALRSSKNNIMDAEARRFATIKEGVFKRVPVKSGAAGRGGNFFTRVIDKAITATTTLSNYKKLPSAVGGIANTMAQSFNTAGAGLLNVVGSVGEIGKKGKSLNPLANFIRRQEGGRSAPLNPARALGFKDKSGMFNLAKDSYLGNMEAFDVATSVPLFKGVLPGVKLALKTGISKQILGKIGLLDSGLTSSEIIKPAISALFKKFKKPVASTVATQITSQVAKQQFRAQEILDQLPRQLPAPPRMLELMPGPKVQQVMPSVPALEQVMPSVSALVERINGAIPLPSVTAPMGLLDSGLGAKLPTTSIDEYILHGGPRVDQLAGGVINPEFIRGGTLWNIMKNFNAGGSIGRTANEMTASAVLTGSERSQNQAAMFAYEEVQNVLQNANKFGVDEYVPNYRMRDFSSPTNSYRYPMMVPQPSSYRNPYGEPSWETGYKWGEQVQYAQNWLDENFEIIRRIQRGEVHSTGVYPSMERGAYEYGAIHLIRVEKALNAAMRSNDTLKGGAPDIEIPFWGTHKPVASVDASRDNYDPSDMSKYYELIHKMIEDANKHMSPSQISDFAFSQRVYGNKITPGARSFILSEFDRGSFHYVKNMEHIRKLLHAARNKDEMKAALAEISRVNKKGNNTNADWGFDIYKTRLDTVIDEFSIPKIFSPGDAVAGVPGKTALESILENIPEHLHKNFYDAMAGIPQHKAAVLQSFSNLDLKPVAELQELSKLIDLTKLGNKPLNFSTPVLEQVMDPVNQAKKAAFLQARGMGGSGAAFNNVQQFLDSVGDGDNLFGQLRVLARSQDPVIGLNSFQKKLVNSYTSSGSGALSFETMRRGSPGSKEFEIFKEILEATSQILKHDPVLGPQINNLGVPQSVSMFSRMPVNEAMRPFIDPEIFEQYLRGESYKYLDVGKHVRSPEDFAAILNIASKELQNIMDTHGVTLTDDILLHRGLGMPMGPADDILKYTNLAYNIGKPLAPQFRSTSVSAGSATSFTKTKAGDMSLIPTLEHIIAPKGSKVFMPNAYGYGMGNEREIIIPPKYRFVPSKVELSNEYRHLDLAEIFGTIVKGTAAGVGALGAVYGLSSNDKVSAAALSEEQRYQSYLRQIRALTDYIAEHESGRVKQQYNAWHGGGRSLMMPGMTSMTINDVIAKSNKKAVGKHQQMPKYLLKRAQIAGFSGSDLYSPEVQEAIMTTMLLKKSNYSLGLIDFLNNKKSTNFAVNLLARHFRSLPGTGGIYFGGGSNPSGFDPERKDLKVKAHLEQLRSYYMPGFKTGGYVPGAPSMPFPAMLHGGEYVINADAVRNMGVATMQNINQSKFRTPSGAPSYQGAGQTSSVSTVNINVDTFIGEEAWFKSMMSSYNVNILPRMQKNAGNETRSFTTYNGLNQ